LHPAKHSPIISLAAVSAVLIAMSRTSLAPLVPYFGQHHLQAEPIAVLQLPSLVSFEADFAEAGEAGFTEPDCTVGAACVVSHLMHQQILPICGNPGNM
jgi:hypothetical protein